MLEVITLVFIFVALAACWLHTSAKSTVSIFVGTIHITDITAAEDVANAIRQFGLVANLTTVDVYLGLTEHITVTVERTVLVQIVVASAAAKHVVMHMAAKHLDHRLAGSV